MVHYSETACICRYGQILNYEMLDDYTKLSVKRTHTIRDDLLVWPTFIGQIPTELIKLINYAVSCRALFSCRNCIKQARNKSN